MKTTTRLIRRFAALLVPTVLGLWGCADSAAPTSRPPGPKALPTTDTVGEFDPNAGSEIVKPHVEVTDPITGPLAVLQNVRVEVPQMAIEHALNLFNASEGRYPETHAEFMTRIIGENKIGLAKLQDGLEYQYDVANHKLVIVRTGDGKVVQ